MYETIELEVRDGVAHLTLNRPEAANGISLELARDLMQATPRDRRRPGRPRRAAVGCRAAFLRRRGSQVVRRHDDLAAHLREVLAFLHVAMAQLVRGDAPVVAAVQGSAAGAGMGLVGASDFVVAGESAKFVMAYTGVGLTPDGASSWFLPRLVGLRRAIELTLTNRVLSAHEALEWGLITKVVPDDDVATTAAELAARLARGPAGALAGAKRLLHESLEGTLESHLAREAEEITAAAARPDAAEGIAAFLAKRPPTFK